MFNKLVKGFVIGTALIGSLTMVGCESTESVLDEGDRVDIENKYYNDNPSELPDIEDEVIEEVDEDEMKGFIEEEGNKEYDPRTKAWAEAVVNEVHLDCTECGGQQSIYEINQGMSLYDACGYCFAIYEDNKFTGKYACNGCEAIVDHKTKPINGEGTALVCNDCYDEYHKPKVNDILDENGSIKNTIPEIEEVEEITKEQAYEIILSEATSLYGNVEVNASDVGYNGITYYASVINPEDREIIASIKVDCITGEVVEVVE